MCSQTFLSVMGEKERKPLVFRKHYHLQHSKEMAKCHLGDRTLQCPTGSAGEHTYLHSPAPSGSACHLSDKLQNAFGTQIHRGQKAQQLQRDVTPTALPPLTVTLQLPAGEETITGWGSKFNRQKRGKVAQQPCLCSQQNTCCPHSMQLSGSKLPECHGTRRHEKRHMNLYFFQDTCIYLCIYCMLTRCIYLFGKKGITAGKNLNRSILI